MSSFSLSDLRTAAEAKYAPTVIELPGGKTVTLANALDLPDAEVQKVEQLQDTANSSATTLVETIDAYRDIIRAVGTPKSAVDLLLKEIGDSRGLLLEIVETWGKSSQVGEASSSPS